ncbi:hypothetical protein OCAR_5295 [Afipia carboxidovorans OM5]|nr:hypothetical protein OCAR_5295 [Afipia carboxidovorans OM5]
MAAGRAATRAIATARPCTLFDLPLIIALNRYLSSQCRLQRMIRPNP